MELAKGFQNEKGFLAVDIDVNFQVLPFFLVTIFKTQLEITEIWLTWHMQIQCYQLHLKSKKHCCYFYVSIYTLLYVQPIVSDLFQLRY